MKRIIIDGYIGNGYYSKQFIKEQLKGSENEPIEVTINSLGGDVDHAISIYDQFIAHGDVTAIFSGFSASAATLIGLGAKKAKMNENAFYLIHKALSWIDVFGYLNDDDIDQVITDLTKKRDQNAKITLQIAKMYTLRTELNVQEVLSLMKEEAWLNSEEAKAKGFVDEIIKNSNRKNLLVDSKSMAMIAASGYPIPGRKNINMTVNSEKVKGDGVNYDILMNLKHMQDV